MRGIRPIFKTGEKVTCTIRGKTILDAKIYIERQYDNGQKAFICHNDIDFGGAEAPNKLGYQYSWTFEITDNITEDGYHINQEVGNLKLAEPVDELAKIVDLAFQNVPA